MNKRFVITGAVLMSVLVSGVLLAKKNTAPESVSTEAQGPKVKGSANARVEIVEYSDFQCPACQRAQPVLHALMEKYPGEIRLAYRHFPLSGHQWSGIAHQSAECAADQGKFWGYQEILFKNQALWSSIGDPTTTFIRYAQETGLDLDVFGACLTDEAVKRRVMDEKESGLKQQVKSTPTFFLNGERLVGHIELGVKGEAEIRKILNLEPLPEPRPAS